MEVRIRRVELLPEVSSGVTPGPKAQEFYKKTLGALGTGLARTGTTVTPCTRETQYTESVVLCVILVGEVASDVELLPSLVDNVEAAAELELAPKAAPRLRHSLPLINRPSSERRLNLHTSPSPPPPLSPPRASSMPPIPSRSISSLQMSSPTGRLRRVREGSSCSSVRSSSNLAHPANAEDGLVVRA